MVWYCLLSCAASVGPAWGQRVWVTCLHTPMQQHSSPAWVSLRRNDQYTSGMSLRLPWSCILFPLCGSDRELVFQPELDIDDLAQLVGV